jgi:succinoglycan biosynthesis transport protein ExoP
MEEAISFNAQLRAAFNRRLSVGLTATVILVIVTIGLAVGLPSFYRSRAVILIEAQEMPQDLVRSLVTSYADQRIQVISQRVLTNSNLSRIIDKYDLYASERKRDPLELVLEQMRQDIVITPISADVTDPKAGRTTPTTIAFELAYESKSPQLAQRVASEIASLFLSENLRQRNETTEQTVAFFKAESEKLREEVGAVEQRLASFKQENIDQLPETNNLNLELLNRADTDIRSLDTQMRSLEQQQVFLETELAKQKPSIAMYSQTGERVLGASDKAKMLQVELPSLTAKYGPAHPDVVAKKKEIAALQSAGQSQSQSGDLPQRLEETKVQLSQMRERYSEDHPDVKRLSREVSELERRVTDERTQSPTAVAEAVPDNPAYIELQARSRGITNDLQGLRAQKEMYKAKMAEVQLHIAKAPEVERQYRGLTRDLETAQAKYQEIMAKRQEAEVSSNLESEQKGERFTLIEPPVTPEEPARPNRWAILLLGGLLSVAGGVGLGVLLENLDGRIYGRLGVVRVLGVPPLAIVPTLVTEGTVKKSRNRRYLVAFAVFTTMIVAAAVVHFTVRPLDVIFYHLLRVWGLR